MFRTLAAAAAIFPAVLSQCGPHVDTSGTVTYHTSTGNVVVIDNATTTPFDIGPGDLLVDVQSDPTDCATSGGRFHAPSTCVGLDF